MSKKYIIDTDIGDDIDDAYAIEYAIKAGLDVVGVTTVFRSTYLRAELSAYLLKLMNRMDIPVFAGSEFPICQPLDAKQKAARYLRGEALESALKGEPWLPQYLDGAKGLAVNKKSAVDFILESAEKYGEDLVILAIGPLTNLARAIEKAPKTMKKIGKIVLMGGNTKENVAEWNVALDPEGAATVFSSGLKIDQIGSDQTWKNATVTFDELVDMRRQTGELGEANNNMLDKWANQPLYRGRIPCMHDSLAVFMVLNEQAFTFDEVTIVVGLEGDGRAKTFVKAGGNVRRVIDVDKKKFRESMWECIYR